MHREKHTAELIAAAVKGKVVGFYDPIDNDTKALLHYKDNRECEILLVREGKRPRTAVHAIAVVETLMLNGYTVSTPIEIVQQFGKTKIQGTGQRLIAKDSYPHLITMAPISG